MLPPPLDLTAAFRSFLIYKSAERMEFFHFVRYLFSKDRQEAKPDVRSSPLSGLNIRIFTGPPQNSPGMKEDKQKKLSPQLARHIVNRRWQAIF